MNEEESLSRVWSRFGFAWKREHVCFLSETGQEHTERGGSRPHLVCMRVRETTGAWLTVCFLIALLGSVVTESCRVNTSEADIEPLCNRRTKPLSPVSMLDLSWRNVQSVSVKVHHVHQNQEMVFTSCCRPFSSFVCSHQSDTHSLPA